MPGLEYLADSIAGIVRTLIGSLIWWTFTLILFTVAWCFARKRSDPRG